MDNPAAPIPSISPLPAVSSLPAESPNHRWFLWLAIGLTFLTLGIAIGVFSAKFLNQSPNLSQLMPTPSSAQSPTLTVAPIVSPEPAAEADDPTANWKTYANNLGVSFKYPSDWVITETDIYVVVMKDPDMRLVVGACPGYSFSVSKFDPLTNYARFDVVTKSVLDSQSVEVWKNKDANCKEKAIFVNQLPSNTIKPKYIISFISNNPDSDKILNQILSTFKFTD